MKNDYQPRFCSGHIPSLQRASTYLTKRKRRQFEIGGDLDSVIIPLLCEEGNSFTGSYTTATNNLLVSIFLLHATSGPGDIRIHGVTKVSEQPFCSESANQKPLFAIAQQQLRPIREATIDQEPFLVS